MAFIGREPPRTPSPLLRRDFSQPHRAPRLLGHRTTSWAHRGRASCKRNFHRSRGFDDRSHGSSSRLRRGNSQCETFPRHTWPENCHPLGCETLDLEFAERRKTPRPEITAAPAPPSTQKSQSAPAPAPHRAASASTPAAARRARLAGARPHPRPLAPGAPAPRPSR